MGNKRRLRLLSNDHPNLHSTGDFLRDVSKHLLINWVLLHYMSKEGWQKSSEVWTLWYLAFKLTKKSSFVKIEVSGEKKIEFSNLSKIQRKILLTYQTDFIFALMFRHLIIETTHFTEWRGMPQREKLKLQKKSRKFN